MVKSPGGIERELSWTESLTNIEGALLDGASFFESPMPRRQRSLSRPRVKEANEEKRDQSPISRSRSRTPLPRLGGDAPMSSLVQRPLVRSRSTQRSIANETHGSSTISTLTSSVITSTQFPTSQPLTRSSSPSRSVGRMTGVLPARIDDQSKSLHHERRARSPTRRSESVSQQSTLPNRHMKKTWAQSRNVQSRSRPVQTAQIAVPLGRKTSHTTPKSRVREMMRSLSPINLRRHRSVSKVNTTGDATFDESTWTTGTSLTASRTAAQSEPPARISEQMPKAQTPMSQVLKASRSESNLNRRRSRSFQRLRSDPIQVYQDPNLSSPSYRPSSPLEEIGRLMLDQSNLSMIARDSFVCDAPPFLNPESEGNPTMTSATTGNGTNDSTSYGDDSNSYSDYDGVYASNDTEESDTDDSNEESASRGSETFTGRSRLSSPTASSERRSPKSRRSNGGRGREKLQSSKQTQKGKFGPNRTRGQSARADELHSTAKSRTAFDSTRAREMSARTRNFSVHSDLQKGDTTLSKNENVEGRSKSVGRPTMQNDLVFGAVARPTSPSESQKNWKNGVLKRFRRGLGSPRRAALERKFEENRQRFGDLREKPRSPKRPAQGSVVRTITDSVEGEAELSYATAENSHVKTNGGDVATKGLKSSDEGDEYRRRELINSLMEFKRVLRKSKKRKESRGNNEWEPESPADVESGRNRFQSPRKSRRNDSMPTTAIRPTPEIIRRPNRPPRQLCYVRLTPRYMSGITTERLRWKNSRGSENSLVHGLVAHVDENGAFESPASVALSQPITPKLESGKTSSYCLLWSSNANAPDSTRGRVYFSVPVAEDSETVDSSRAAPDQEIVVGIKRGQDMIQLGYAHIPIFNRNVLGLDVEIEIVPFDTKKKGIFAKRKNAFENDDKMYGLGNVAILRATLDIKRGRKRGSMEGVEAPDPAEVKVGTYSRRNENAKSSMSADPIPTDSPDKGSSTVTSVNDEKTESSFQIPSNSKEHALVRVPSKLPGSAIRSSAPGESDSLRSTVSSSLWPDIGLMFTDMMTWNSESVAKTSSLVSPYESKPEVGQSGKDMVTKSESSLQGLQKRQESQDWYPADNDDNTVPDNGLSISRSKESGLVGIEPTNSAVETRLREKVVKEDVTPLTRADILLQSDVHDDFPTLEDADPKSFEEALSKGLGEVEQVVSSAGVLCGSSANSLNSDENFTMSVRHRHIAAVSGANQSETPMPRNDFRDSGSDRQQKPSQSALQDTTLPPNDDANSTNLKPWSSAKISSPRASVRLTPRRKNIPNDQISIDSGFTNIGTLEHFIGVCSAMTASARGGMGQSNEFHSAQSDRKSVVQDFQTTGSRLRGSDDVLPGGFERTGSSKKDNANESINLGLRASKSMDNGDSSRKRTHYWGSLGRKPPHGNQGQLLYNQDISVGCAAMNNFGASESLNSGLSSLQAASEGRSNTSFPSYSSSIDSGTQESSEAGRSKVESMSSEKAFFDIQDGQRQLESPEEEIVRLAMELEEARAVANTVEKGTQKSNRRQRSSTTIGGLVERPPCNDSSVKSTDSSVETRPSARFDKAPPSPERCNEEHGTFFDVAEEENSIPSQQSSDQGTNIDSVISKESNQSMNVDSLISKEGASGRSTDVSSASEEDEFAVHQEGSGIPVHPPSPSRPKTKPRPEVDLGPRRKHILPSVPPTANTPPQHDTQMNSKSSDSGPSKGSMVVEPPGIESMRDLPSQPGFGGRSSIDRILASFDSSTASQPTDHDCLGDTVESVFASFLGVGDDRRALEKGRTHDRLVEPREDDAFQDLQARNAAKANTGRGNINSSSRTLPENHWRHGPESPTRRIKGYDLMPITRQESESSNLHLLQPPRLRHPTGSQIRGSVEAPSIEKNFPYEEGFEMILQNQHSSSKKRGTEDSKTNVSSDKFGSKPTSQSRYKLHAHAPSGRRRPNKPGVGVYAPQVVSSIDSQTKTPLAGNRSDAFFNRLRQEQEELSAPKEEELDPLASLSFSFSESNLNGSKSENRDTNGPGVAGNATSKRNGTSSDVMEGLRQSTRKKRPSSHKRRQKKEKQTIREDRNDGSEGERVTTADKAGPDDFESATRKLFEISKKLGVAPETLLSRLESGEEIPR